MLRLIAIVLLVPAVAAGDDDLDVPGLDASDLRGDALAWEDATFYFEPWETGANVRFASFGRGRHNEVGRAVPVRIVDSSMRTFVEVELPDRADCSWRKIDTDKRVDGLRVYVKREDLAPVLVKPYAAQYGDGTKIKLGIGAPVMPTSSGDYLIAAKSDKLRLSIPHSSVGYLYKAGKVADPELPAGKLVRVDRNVNARMGDESFTIRSNWIVPSPDKKTDVALVRWNSRCLDLTVQVPATSLRPTDAPRVTTPTPPPVPPLAGWRIPTGAPLMTASGREVAVASAPIGVGTPSGDTACFDARFTLLREDETYYPQNRTVKLCASVSVLER